jgi:hypothetical protein
VTALAVVPEHDVAKLVWATLVMDASVRYDAVPGWTFFVSRTGCVEALRTNAPARALS